MLIAAACLFYVPTTMVLMYCYGTIFHASKSSLVAAAARKRHLSNNLSSSNAIIGKDVFGDRSVGVGVGGHQTNNVRKTT